MHAMIGSGKKASRDNTPILTTLFEVPAVTVHPAPNGCRLQTMRWLILAGIFLLAATTFFTGINWGLPSRESDPILFGSKTPWTGQQIMDLAGAWDTTGNRGADIAMHPLDSSERNQPILLNDTDAKRAEIVRRYRLYSNQPDEMITFRSLSRMKPGELDLDPRMYQYGGLWIYPIGLILKIASIAGLVTLRPDLAFYLDHPEAFARFYLVARLYAAVWGMVGVAAVYALGREWTGEFLVGATAAGLYAAMPVAIDLAHEAKPHLPGAVLVMIAIWAAMRYARTGLTRWWMIAGASAGAAMGMVLTGYVAFAVLPVMALLRPMSWKNRCGITAGATLIAIAIFTISNPYLPYNLLLHRQVLHSNVGNYGTFYQPRFTISGIVLAARLLIAGTSPVVATLGALCLIASIGFLPVRGWLLAVPAIIVLIQFVLLADGKSAEYARFALLPDIIAAVMTAALIARLKIKPRERVLAAAWFVGATLYFGLRYDLNFIADGWPNSTRRLAAQSIDSQQPGSSSIGVWAEPAPYCLPPIDLFHWRLFLLPRGSMSGEPGQIVVRPVDDLSAAPIVAESIRPQTEPSRAASPISWANKPFEIVQFRQP